jgi:deazaflavin-dependent oxidoreductase (nitroreductase family)
MQITLTTTGRKSGLPRPVTLYGWEDGDDLVVVGSRGGGRRDPAWVVNLRADPRATVRRGKETYPVRAREVGGSERERLWQLVVDRFPNYGTYQRRTTRIIPLFVLEATPKASD